MYQDHTGLLTSPGMRIFLDLHFYGLACFRLACSIKESADVPSLSVDELAERFRANLFVTGSSEPYEEDKWTRGQIGNLNFTVSIALLDGV